MDRYLRNIGFQRVLGLSENELQRLNAIHTATEILQQPLVWKKTFDLMLAEKQKVCDFLDRAIKEPSLDIILTGAGSSSFIGRILEGFYNRFTKHASRAVATTDLLTHPHNYVDKSRPLLLVSFARSGNSPESTAVPDLLGSICPCVYHLVITCNASGQLASSSGSGENELVILLPVETEDKSLVMTSSFTGMLLAGLLISRINEIERFKPQVEQLAAYGQRIFEQYAGAIRKVADLGFDRVVFLGSGPLLGAAEEAQLKVQELTDGKVVGKHDSFLGFRHGPKAVINNRTLLVFLFSNDDYVHNYEADLVRDIINTKQKGVYSLGITESSGAQFDLDLSVVLADGDESIGDEFASICAVLPAQLLGFFKCLKLGLKPDNPSESGAITRIVQGVNIYPYEHITF